MSWRGGTVAIADRWYPSSKLCPACGVVRHNLKLANRVFTCGCGYSADRDTNAAVNLARWGRAHQRLSQDPWTSKQGAGPPTPADGTALTDTLRVPVKPSRVTRELTFAPRPRTEPTTPEKGGAEQAWKLFGTL
jgi:hypothetical protein